jgi:hypothetical protein
MAYLQFAFFAAAVVAVYWFWLRPIMKTIPAFDTRYLETDNFWKALKLRFQGIKGHLASVSGAAASVIVYLHDQLLPYATGVDWAPITAQVPGWVWPIVLFCAFLFIGQCRKWAEQRGTV